MKTEVGAAWIEAWIERAKLSVGDLAALQALSLSAASPDREVYVQELNAIARETFHLAKKLGRELLNGDPPHEVQVYIQEVNRIADACRELIG